MSPQALPTTRTYFVRTFGCQMNVHDSEHICGVLEASGYTRAPSISEAELVVFNTCCVRQSAEDRVWGNLGALPRADGSKRVVAVCGCMAERHGVEIMRRSPVVNLVFGMDALARLPELVIRSLQAPICDLGDVKRARIDCLPDSRASSVQAWVPVSHGCDNGCAYCVVPAVRGPERSRPPGEIVDEVRRLGAAGVVEIILLGQNVNSYGRDLPGSASFACLLETVAGVDGIRRVKFETSHPRDLSDDILDVMSGVPEVCEYLHLPVQSGSNRVLEAMRRGYTREYYSELASRAREKVPGLTLTTDIIVGFPCETEQDFAATMHLVSTVEFEAAYTFIYSAREGTTAAGMPGEVADETKHRRFNELARLQEGITARALEKVVGCDVEVVVEGDSKRGDLVTARTRGHQVVLLPRATYGGNVLTAHIYESGRHTLRGRIRTGQGDR
jgi:tRNA-2-methylthio-N6-dimethylallyladenosine synthase